MTNTPNSSPLYLTKREAAEYIRLSPRSVERLFSRGELKAYRPGRKLLFLRCDLDDFIQRHPALAELNNLIAELSDSNES